MLRVTASHNPKCRNTFYTSVTWMPMSFYDFCRFMTAVTLSTLLPPRFVWWHDVTWTGLYLETRETSRHCVMLWSSVLTLAPMGATWFRTLLIGQDTRWSLVKVFHLPASVDNTPTSLFANWFRRGGEMGSVQQLQAAFWAPEFRVSGMLSHETGLLNQREDTRYKCFKTEY